MIKWQSFSDIHNSQVIHNYPKVEAIGGMESVISTVNDNDVENKSK